MEKSDIQLQYEEEESSIKDLNFQPQKMGINKTDTTGDTELPEPQLQNRYSMMVNLLNKAKNIVANKAADSNEKVLDIQCEESSSSGFEENQMIQQTHQIQDTPTNKLVSANSEDVDSSWYDFQEGQKKVVGNIRKVMKRIPKLNLKTVLKILPESEVQSRDLADEQIAQEHRLTEHSHLKPGDLVWMFSSTPTKWSGLVSIGHKEVEEEEHQEEEMEEINDLIT